MSFPQNEFFGENDMNRSEEHTSELQSRENLVCRLLLEKKKRKYGSTKHRRPELGGLSVHIACLTRRASLPLAAGWRPSLLAGCRQSGTARCCDAYMMDQ